MSAPYFKDVPQPQTLAAGGVVPEVSPPLGAPQAPLDLSGQMSSPGFVPEAVKSGRARTGTVGSFIAGVAAAQFIAADNKRVALRISAPSVNRITISDNPNVVIDAGVNLAAGGTALELTIEVYGNFITKRLYMVASAASTQIGFIESRLEAL